MSAFASAHTAPRVLPGKILPRAFYARETELVARELLGAIIWRKKGDRVTAGRIVETEAYLGEHDGACHAAAGLTRRTAQLYGDPGSAYVYFIYGMYWCVNAVTRARGCPSAVLIRAIEPVDGLELMRRRRSNVRNDVQLTNGPGKLCMALEIDGRHHGGSLLSGDLTIRRGVPIADEAVSVSPRIGISRAVDWPLRFFISGSPYVSRTPDAFPVTQYSG